MMAFPKLRFKNAEGAEFTSWVTSFIGDECKITTGNKDTQNKIDGGKYPFFVRSQTVERINTYSKDCEAILTSGDGVGVGKNYHYINGKFDFHQRVYCLYDFSNQLLGKYLYIYFSNYFFDRVKRLSAKNSVDSVRMDMISKMEIKLPSLVEQTKIASFLTAVDEKISQLSQKHELLSQYKQGMMQKLFSQQIRFKADDGSEFGEWDEYSLDTLLSKIIDNRGKTPVTEANLEIPLIEVNAIGQRRIKYEKVSKYFSEDTFQNWFRAYLEHQDILFSTVGNTAICSIYTDEIKAGIAQNIVGLRANIKLIQPTFLYYLLTEISNNQKFKSIEMQAVQPSIKVSQMIHLTFLTPCLEEQSKIANFLSSIDQKIEVVAQQIEQAKLWKKGLLQQMFV